MMMNLIKVELTNLYWLVHHWRLYMEVKIRIEIIINNYFFE